MTPKYRYLYRGVSPEYYKKTGGKLIPKSVRDFSYVFKWGEPGLHWGSGAKWGSSPVNAVLRHQLNQVGYPTSVISTTPHLYRAKFYATKGGELKSGYVYKIDRKPLKANDVIEFIVKEYVTSPSIPEDDEVILVAKDFGPLPNAIIIEIITVETDEHHNDSSKKKP